MAKTINKRMTEKEQKDWNDLYEFVRHTILGYDEHQSLSKNMVLRLKGLQTNKYMANNNIKDTANYPFDVIFNTFKFCMPDIQKRLQTCSFADEDHKFSYILKIVESKLNTVYLRMKNTEKSKEKVKTMELDTAIYSGADYQTKSEKTSERLNDLW